MQGCIKEHGKAPPRRPLHSRDHSTLKRLRRKCETRISDRSIRVPRESYSVTTFSFRRLAKSPVSYTLRTLIHVLIRRPLSGSV
jgi:hypothetical protein